MRFKRKINKRKKPKWFSYTMVGIISASSALGIAAAIAIPKILEMYHGLQNFIPNKHKWTDKSLKAEEQGLNYVSLGDSIGAGYSSQIGQDYLGFSDFIAKDMRKANELHKYDDLAVDGATIDEMHNEVTKTPSVIKAIQDADLITIHIGSNDLLSYLRVVAAQMGKTVGELIGLPSIHYDPNRDNALPGQGSSASDPLSVNFRWQLVHNTLTQLSGMVSSNNFADLLNVQQQLIKPAFDLIKRDIITLVADIGKTAPHADIMILSPAFPFPSLPNSLKYGQVGVKEYKNFMDAYHQLGKSISAVAGMSGGFVQYQSLDKLPLYANDNSGYLFRGTNQVVAPSTDTKAACHIIANPSKAQIADPEWHWRKMPNMADIHPSVYGYSLMGNGLFQELANKKEHLLDINSNASNYFQQPKPFDPSDNTKQDAQNFEMIDEGNKGLDGKGIHNAADVMGREVLRNNTTHNLIAEIMKAIDASKSAKALNQVAAANDQKTPIDEIFKALFGDLNVNINDLEHPFKNIAKIKEMLAEPNVAYSLTQIIMMLSDAGSQKTSPAAVEIHNFIVNNPNNPLTKIINMTKLMWTIMPSIVNPSIAGILSESQSKTADGLVDQMGLKSLGPKLKNELANIKVNQIVINQKSKSIDKFMNFVDRLNVSYNKALNLNPNFPVDNIWTKISEQPRSLTPQLLEKIMNDFKAKKPSDFDKFIADLPSGGDPQKFSISWFVGQLISPLLGIADLSRDNLTNNKEGLAKDLSVESNIIGTVKTANNPLRLLITNLENIV